MLLPLRTIHLSGGKEGKEGVQKNPKQLFLDISSMSPVSSSLPTLVCTDLRKQVNAEEGTGLQIQRDRGVISSHAEYQLWGVFVISLGCGVFSGKIGSVNDNYMTCNHVCQVPRIRGFPGAAVVKKKKKSACQQETQVWSLGQEDPLEKEMATHSSVLAWETHGQRSLAGYTVHGVTKNQTQLSEHKKHLEYGRLNNSEFFPWNFSCISLSLSADTRKQRKAVLFITSPVSPSPSCLVWEIHPPKTKQTEPLPGSWSQHTSTSLERRNWFHSC